MLVRLVFVSPYSNLHLVFLSYGFAATMAYQVLYPNDDMEPYSRLTSGEIHHLHFLFLPLTSPAAFSPSPSGYLKIRNKKSRLSQCSFWRPEAFHSPFFRDTSINSKMGPP